MGEEPPRQKIRVGDPAENSLRERMVKSWPANREGLKDSPNEMLAMLLDHDGPHQNCAWERWYLNGHIGANDRFGFFASFARRAFVDDFFPPTEEEDVRFGYSLSWAVVDRMTKQYYRFSELDSQTPLFASAVLAQDGSSGEYDMSVALAEQLAHDRIPLPDCLSKKPARAVQNTLDLSLGECSLKILPRQSKSDRGFPHYRLYLEGVSNETGGEDLHQEVRTVLEIVFRPAAGPALQGTNGIVTDGHWDTEYFSYCIPHSNLVMGTVRILRAFDDMELAKDIHVENGRVWMGREFGGALPRSVKEAEYLRCLRQLRQASVPTGRGLPGVAPPSSGAVWEWCSFRLDNDSRDTVSVMVTPEPSGSAAVAGDSPAGDVVVSKAGRVGLRIHALVQSKATGTTTYHSDGITWTPLPSSNFRSPKTGVLYPTRWKLVMPLRDATRLEVDVIAALPAQEFVTLAALPAFWEGSVSVVGKTVSVGGTAPDASRPDAGVTGLGFVECRGSGSQSDVDRILAIVHRLTCVAMESAEVASLDSPEEISVGPALNAISTVSMLLAQQDQTFTESQKVLFTVFLGAYGFVFHHFDKPQKVREALRWCHGKWLSYFGTVAVDLRTLLLRAFFLRSLQTVLKAKCGTWVTEEDMEALVMAVPSNEIAERGAAVYSEAPTDAEIGSPADELGLNRLKALIEGKFTLDRTKGLNNSSTFLAAEGVPVAWRTYFSKSNPTVTAQVDVKRCVVHLSRTTALGTHETENRLDGVAWDWKCPGFGFVTSRASLLRGGSVLYIETVLRRMGSVERRWISFEDDGKVMVSTKQFYRTTKAGEAPLATCVKHYVLVVDSDAN